LASPNVIHGAVTAHIQFRALAIWLAAWGRTWAKHIFRGGVGTGRGQAYCSRRAAQARPGLAQAALAMARILDNPKATNQQRAAAKVLSALLDKLHSASARGRRGGLALVRTMTEKGGA
jgi:hypothetical protein